MVSLRNWTHEKSCLCSLTVKTNVFISCHWAQSALADTHIPRNTQTWARTHASSSWARWKRKGLKTWTARRDGGGGLTKTASAVKERKNQFVWANETSYFTFEWRERTVMQLHQSLAHSKFSSAASRQANSNMSLFVWVNICFHLFREFFQSLVAFEDVYLEATCVATKAYAGSQVVFSTVGSSPFNRNIVSWPRSSNLPSFKWSIDHWDISWWIPASLGIHPDQKSSQTSSLKTSWS